MEIGLSIILIIISCIIIWKASDGFDVASEYLGRYLGEGVKGATINAIGSSMPELFTTLLFLFLYQDDQGFASGIGTTAGSAIFNAIIIPSSIIITVVFVLKTTVTVSKKVILRDSISLIITELFLIYFVEGGVLTWEHGVFLIFLYLIYVVLLFTTMKKENIDLRIKDESDEETGNRLSALFKLDLETALIGDKPFNTLNAWTLLLISMFVIGVACFLLVHSCELFGEATGVPLYFVSVIIASAATSVPDTILSIRDAQKGNYDDALSNAIGSNVFDICFALGFPLFLFTFIYNRDIILSEQVILDVTVLQVLLLFMTIITTLIFLIGNSLGKIKVCILLLMYIAFVGFIVAQSLNADWTQPIIENLVFIGEKIQLK
ncbi:MAG: sodium:calcium antiporter [Flavobacteriales bacterium]